MYEPAAEVYNDGRKRAIHAAIVFSRGKMKSHVNASNLDLDHEPRLRNT